MIFGGSLVNVIIFARSKRVCCLDASLYLSERVCAARLPMTDRPVIDYVTVLMMEPLLLAGTIGIAELYAHACPLAYRLPTQWA